MNIKKILKQWTQEVWLPICFVKIIIMTDEVLFIVILSSLLTDCS